MTRGPYDEETFVTTAWGNLRRGRCSHAERMFRVVLENNPLSDAAREGLLEAIKGRQWYYRLVLRCGVKLSDVVTGEGRLSTGWMLGIFAGLPGGLISAIRKNPEVGPYLWPVVLVIVGYLVFAQLADYAATMRVRAGVDGPEYVSNSLLTGAVLGSFCLLGGIGAFALYFKVDHIAALLAMLMLIFLIVPIDATFSRPLGTTRIWMVLVLVGLAICAVMTVTIAAVECEGKDWDEHIPASAGICFLIFVGGAIGSIFLGKMLSEYGERSTEYIDNSMRAGNPGDFTLSDEKLKAFHPEIYGFRAMFHGILHGDRGATAKEMREMVRQHMVHGDARAAQVISVNPLQVAAYTDELDCIAVLEFKGKQTAEYNLRPGERLLTVNSYMDEPPGGDLRPGPATSGRFENFWPLIAQFLSDDSIAINDRMSKIPEKEWQRVQVCIQQYLQNPGAKRRNGHPFESLAPIGQEF